MLPENHEALRGSEENTLLLVLSHYIMSRSFATPWTVVHQFPLSMGFPRQEYWSGLPFPPPGDLPNQGTEPTFYHWATWEARRKHEKIRNEETESITMYLIQRPSTLGMLSNIEILEQHLPSYKLLLCLHFYLR